MRIHFLVHLVRACVAARGMNSLITTVVMALALWPGLVSAESYGPLIAKSDNSLAWSVQGDVDKLSSFISTHSEYPEEFSPVLHWLKGNSDKISEVYGNSTGRFERVAISEMGSLLSIAYLEIRERKPFPIVYQFYNSNEERALREWRLLGIWVGDAAKDRFFTVVNTATSEGIVLINLGAISEESDSARPTLP